MDLLQKTVVVAVALLVPGLMTADTATTKKPAAKAAAGKSTAKSVPAKKGAPVHATTPKSVTTSKSATGHVATAKSTPATKKAPASKTALHKTGTTAAYHRRPASTSATVAKPPATTWRTRQMQPTPERYKEIQQALAGKGYLTGDPNGVWNQNSVDALRRFQQDQKLDPSGKIDALSLIALGLGPKHETAAVKPVPAPEAQPTTN